MRARLLLIGVLIVALVGGVAYAVSRGLGARINLLGKQCEANAEGTVRLDSDQMANTATIVAVGLRRKLPERAMVVAVATARQESKLRNLSGGDRDSVGLFQQRPSQGWGSPEQLRDPRYAVNAFYDRLLAVPGWQRMRVTEAAQAVQRSAHPDAYQKWVADAQVLTRAFIGASSGAVACSLPDDPEMRGAPAARSLSRGMKLDWGDVAAQVPADGRGVAVRVPDERTGWRYAHWLVAHAASHGVQLVRFRDMEWTADRGSWRKGESAGGQRVVAEVYP